MFCALYVHNSQLSKMTREGVFELLMTRSGSFLYIQYSCHDAFIHDYKGISKNQKFKDKQRAWQWLIQLPVYKLNNLHVPFLNRYGETGVFCYYSLHSDSGKKEYIIVYKTMVELEDLFDENRLIY